MKVSKSKLFEDNERIVNYYIIIKEIEDNISSNNLNQIINLAFENDIDFIDPLFIIYILNLYEKLEVDKKYKNRNIKIVLDLRKLPEKVQHNILTYFTQYIDYSFIEISHKEYKVADIFLLNTHKNNISKILLYTTVKENSTTLLEKKDYHFLPITKLTNISEDEFRSKSYWVTKNNNRKIEVDNNSNRKIFYNSIRLETEEKGIYKNKSDKVWTDIFETYLGIAKSKTDTMNGFKNILTEVVENIQKHTNGSNGYIAFYQDKFQNEFYVCDDYEIGFLDTYLSTMRAEKEDENKLTTIEKYDKIISNLENKNYINVLEDIFNLKHILSTQKSRIKKHFGFPLLLKLISKINNKNALLEIYIRNCQGDSYKVKYINGIAKAEELVKNSVQGTILHIKFPKGTELKDKIETKEVLNLTTDNYKEKFTLKPKLIEQIKLFQEVSFDDVQNRIPLKKESIIINFDLKSIKNFNISKFLDDLFSYAYLKEVKDILIINFPLQKYSYYSDILLETSDVTDISNIAFLDELYPKVMFIGGKDEDEFKYINYNLSENYNYNKENYADEKFDKTKKVLIDSNLFFTKKDKTQIFIPFELFIEKKKGEYVYTDMINNYLDEEGNYVDLHIDTKYDFHLKKFYFFKNIFENSTWINRIAFNLSEQIKKNDNNNLNNIVFVAIEKYSTFILSVVKHIMDRDSIDTFYINDINEKKTSQFEEFIKKHKDKCFIFLYPVVFEDYNIDTYIKDINQYQLYSIIKLKYTGMKPINQKVSYIFEKSIDSIIAPKDNYGHCIDCFSGDEKPLYEIDKDRYNIKNIFTDKIQNISIPDDESEEKRSMHYLNWKNAIHFGHTERGTNHYLYYIKSNQFFINNKNPIKDFLEKLIEKENYLTEKIPVIFAPQHDTNNNFISTVDSIVFKNNAVIHTFDLNNKEQNLHNLTFLKNKYSVFNKYEFFFVDDTISSGATLEYFYYLLQQLNTQFIFKAVFSMIDRTSKNYKNDFLNKFTKKIHIFTTLLIKPIKTGFEDCYLCQRRRELKKFKKNSSLVYIKDQFDKKLTKLSFDNSKDVEYKRINQIDDFKTFLKTYAVQYIYENTERFKYEEIDKIIESFTEQSMIYFTREYLDYNIRPESVEKFIEFEAKIAFIKTLAFPKILFIESIRNKIHKYIIKKLKDEIFDKDKKIKINIESILSIDHLKELKKFEEINDIYLYYTDKKRTETDFINFLISTAAYLNINYVISYEMLEYYAKLTLHIKDNYEGELYKKYKNLLRIYPVAMKMVVSFSEEKSEYFKRNLISFNKTENRIKYEGKYSRIFGLQIENYPYMKDNNYLVLDDDIILDNDQNEKFNTLIEFFKKEIKTTIEKCMDIEKIHFYIDTNENRHSSNLIDIFDDLYKLNTDDYVKLLYQGAKIKTSLSQDTLELEESEEYNTNIWSNFYKNHFTYIRITNNDLIPIGVIKILHKKKNDNLFEHLEVSKSILKVQTNIGKFLKRYSLTSQLRYQNQIVQKEIYENILGNLKHTNISLRKLLQDNMNSIDKDDIYNYTFAAYHKNLINILELKDTKHNYTSVRFYINDEFIENVNNYYKSYPKLKAESSYELKFNVINEIKDDFKLRLTGEIIESIIFELIDNSFTHKEDMSQSDQLDIIYDIKIHLISYRNTLYILNEGTSDNIKNNIDEHDEIFKFGYTSRSTGYGLYFIKRVLNQNKIEISYAKDIPKQFTKNKNITFALKIKEMDYA